MDNEAANQMTTDHVGIRGLFKVAACLNVASEQFTDINCEFSNDAAGPVYGFAGDAFNMLHWIDLFRSRRSRISLAARLKLRPFPTIICLSEIESL